MPKSSRHKSHKQSKHSNKEYYSGSEEDSCSKVKIISTKEENNNNTIRVSSKDLSSGEKRPNASTGEYVASKRRKDRADVEGNDRWNGGGDFVNVVDDTTTTTTNNDNNNSEIMKGESSKIEGLRSKGLSDVKGKSSRRHESDKREENVGVGIEKEESSKSGKVESKMKDKVEKEKGDKDSRRKEVYKDVKEKDRERDKKGLEGKRYSDTEEKRKQGTVDGREEEKSKRGVENNDRLLEDELQKRDSEKELEKRRRRKAEGSSEKDKHLDDIREGDDSRVSSRSERDKDGRYKDERHKDGGHREKYRDEIDRDNRHRDGKQRDNIDREKRYRDDKFRDERTSKDHHADKNDFKYSRNESDAGDSRHKKSRSDNSYYDGSPVYDDRASRYKEDMEKRRNDDKEDYSDIRSRSVKEHHDLEKKSMGTDKDLVPDRGRSHSRRSDSDFNLGPNKRRTSPSSSSHAAKDQYRYSSETKYRDSVREERVHVAYSKEVISSSGVSERGYPSRSMEKSSQKDDGRLGELSSERRRNLDARTSPVQLVEKSPSSSSTDRRYQGRSSDRRSLDFEDSGQRNSSFKDAKQYSGYEGKGSQDLPMEASSADEISQADGDTMSVSSPFNRSTRLPSNSKSLLPPPPHRSSLDNSSNIGSFDDDNRGKPNNRFMRMGDSNMGRVQGNAWKGVPNWSSPVTNGFMPYPLGPPPVGFHPVMQQFSAPPMFGVRPSMELNSSVVFPGHGRPYGWQNAVDESCPPPMHGWDANNGVLGDGFHMYGRLDWGEHGRNIMSNGSREASVETWKAQNDRVIMESLSTPQKDDNVLSTMNEVMAAQSSQQAKIEENHVDKQVDSNLSIGTLLSDSLLTHKNVPKKETETKISTVDDDNCVDYGVRHSCAYLSKLDISADLTHEDLYKQCADLMGKNNGIAANTSKLDMEDVVEARVKISAYTPHTSLFTAINDSIFEKAMSLYKKHREGMFATILPLISNGNKVPVSPSTENPDFVSIDNEKEASPISVSHPDEEMALPLVSSLPLDGTSISDTNQAIAEEPPISPKVEVQSPISDKVEDGPVLSDNLEVPTDEPVTILKDVKMEVDLGPNQEKTSASIDEKSSIQAMNSSPCTTPDNQEGQATVQSTTDNLEGNLPVGRAENDMLIDRKDEPLLISTVSSEACEAVRPELNELESVSLSRIHHSPESTH